MDVLCSGSSGSSDSRRGVCGSACVLSVRVSPVERLVVKRWDGRIPVWCETRTPIPDPLAMKESALTCGAVHRSAAPDHDHPRQRPISVDFLIYWKIADPLMSIVNVANFAGALQGVAATTCGPSSATSAGRGPVPARAHQRNASDQARRGHGTLGRQGYDVEIREIMPPPAVQDAMKPQLFRRAYSACRDYRIEGTRQATINVAEGDKQSAILRAEGDRAAAILRAQGFSEALQTIFKAAHGIDQKTMTLQYLDALKSLGTGTADEVREFPRGSSQRHARAMITEYESDPVPSDLSASRYWTSWSSGRCHGLP